MSLRVFHHRVDHCCYSAQRALATVTEQSENKQCGSSESSDDESRISRYRDNRYRNNSFESSDIIIDTELIDTETKETDEIEIEFEESLTGLNELLFCSNTQIAESFQTRTQNKDEYSEGYMDFVELHILLNDILCRKVKAKQLFIEYLDLEWNKYQHFAQETALKISKCTTTKSEMVTVLKFNQFIWINQQCLSDLISKYDSISSDDNKLRKIWEWKLNWKPQQILFKSIKKISNLYNNNNNNNNNDNGRKKGKKKKKKKINNYLFDRECTKFWVSHENVFQVIGIIIQHLPIYIYGKKKESPQVYQLINSVYFDNDQFKCYHERIQKEEGARSFRIRWYDQIQPLNGRDIVFMERKLHHSGAPSLKERFEIKNENVLPFINGNDLTINGGKMNDKLKTEMFDFIKEYNLTPKTRTVCKRISFQLNDCNDLRISLDLNLKFIKEKNNLLNENLWFTDSQNIYEENVARFPFDILEIKLAGNAVENPPKWIQDLMDSSLLIECYKFSKYGQSVNQFYQNKINVIPKWIQYNDNIKIQNDIKSHIDIDDTNNDNKNCLKCWKPKCCQKNKKNKIKKEVNPKVYFSNERTFLGWFQAAVFVGGSGLTIHSIDQYNPVGHLLIGVAFAILLWAIFIYYKRNYLLLKGQLNGLHDFYGPIILVSVIIYVFAYSIISDSSHSPKHP